jgi:hypothetical protein
MPSAVPSQLAERLEGIAMRLENLAATLEDGQASA